MPERAIELCPISPLRRCGKIQAPLSPSGNIQAKGGNMVFEGGCYCGGVRYRAEGEPLLEGQCHCRECQYITGGEPNTFIALPIAGFAYTKGNPASYTRTDVPNAVTRRFCPT